MKTRLLKGKKGVTLVEAVVSLAILSILAVFILTVFSSSFSIIGDNANLKKQNKNAAAGIENKLAGFDPDANLSVTDQQDDSLQIDFGGVTINPGGKTITGSDKDNNAKFYFFIPD